MTKRDSEKLKIFLPIGDQKNDKAKAEAVVSDFIKAVQSKAADAEKQGKEQPPSFRALFGSSNVRPNRSSEGALFERDKATLDAINKLIEPVKLTDTKEINRMIIDEYGFVLNVTLPVHE